MSDDQGPEQTPPLLRALTELFYVAENVALVCGHLNNATIVQVFILQI